MINLPRKQDKDLLKRDEDLQKRREAFISNAPLKEGIKEAPQPAPIMHAAISPQEETPAFQDFKISKEKPKEKKVKQRRKKKARRNEHHTTTRGAGICKRPAISD